MKKICSNCQNEFSVKVLIDGKTKYLYNRNCCLVCSPIGSHNTRRTILPKAKKENHKICSKCKEEKPFSEFHFDKYNENYRSFCKPCDHKRVTDYQRANKQICLDYKGGKCQICGYDKYNGALEFHHTDPEQKDFNLSDFSVYNLNNIKKELDKCVVLCANCHREVHGNISAIPV